MRVFVLTGAGVSAESGLGTFGDRGGIWTRYDLSKVATPEGYAEDPARVLDFYNARRRNLLGARHNAAHEALARLGRELAARGGELFLCTQNIDDLHERGGSQFAVHMHGELLKARCLGCGSVHAWREDITVWSACPACSREGRLRPHVVWFGETPLHMEEIQTGLEACDLFVAIGTSGSVHPAAGFVAEARAAGARTLELNLEPSDGARRFHEGRYGLATEVVPAWVQAVLSEA